jgi:hypothetical protein
MSTIKKAKQYLNSKGIRVPEGDTYHDVMETFTTHVLEDLFTAKIAANRYQETIREMENEVHFLKAQDRWIKNKDGRPDPLPVS